MITPQVILSLTPYFKSILHRASNIHKGQAGKVAIVAGSPKMIGAAILCAHGAFRAGAGLVTMLVPEPLIARMQPLCLEALYLPLPHTQAGTLKPNSTQTIMNYFHQFKWDSLVIGPGLGRDLATLFLIRRLVQTWVSECQRPIIVDADALFALSPFSEIFPPNRCIFTPHDGELARLFPGLSPLPKVELAQHLARQTGQTWVLKGNPTIIASPQYVYTNTTGNAGMATAGSGDCLSGIIGALAAVTPTPDIATMVGVHIHGLAGDWAARKLGPHSVTASDIIQNIAVALQEVI